MRYSENQNKYVLTVLKKGLGQDRDNDLVKEFEIVIDGKHCKISGDSAKYKSLKELLAHYKCAPLHPSIANIGGRCPSPRFSDHMERRESKKVQIAAQMLMQDQREEAQQQMKDMEAKIQHLENRSTCIIL